MENLDTNHLLIIGGIVAIIAEILMGAATGFDLLLAGIIAIIAGGIGLFTGSVATAIVAVGVLSFIYIIIGRRFIKNTLSISTQPMSLDNLVHKHAKVTKHILSDKPGQIKVEGEIWRAEADVDIAVGTEVEIVSVSGVTLKVKVA